MKKKNRYEKLIEAIFFKYYKEKSDYFEFGREDIESFSQELNIPLPKNLGDLIYSFRYRMPLPDKIVKTCPEKKQWIILPAGRSKYRFQLIDIFEVYPNPNLMQIKIPDATPGIISNYCLSDEQALLAKLRYNRLVDIFTRVTCYSLQNHLRTTVPDIGQIETDEVYVGLDRNGNHFVFTVQAKSEHERLNIVQIHQDIHMCIHKFPKLICRPLGAQFLSDNVIVLFEFCQTKEGIRIIQEKHYNLVPPEEITEADLKNYRKLDVTD